MRRDLALLDQGKIQQRDLSIDANHVKTDLSMSNADAKSASATYPDVAAVSGNSENNVDRHASDPENNPVKSDPDQEQPAVDVKTKEAGTIAAGTGGVAEDTTAPEKHLTITTEANNSIDDMAITEAERADKAPDTAFSANADMDSLFNDPVHIGPTHGGQNGTEDVIDFADTNNDAADFNFGLFDTALETAGPDGGLQQLDLGGQSFDDGNSAQGEPDFNALFGDLNGQDSAPSIGTGADQDIFKFDELMDVGMTDTGANSGEPPDGDA